MKSLDQNSLSSNWKYLLPISLLVFLVPLIVFMKVVQLTPIEIVYWKGGAENPDFFSYYKMITLNVLTVLAMIFTYFYFKRDDRDLIRTKIYIPMAVYGVLIVLSTLLAEHKSVAFVGFVDRYEGVLVLLSYLVLMFIVLNIVNDSKSAKIILYPLIASATIIGLIGVFQYMGYDFFQTSFGKRQILPLKYSSMADQLQFNFGATTIYSTLYNTNYVGSYMAIVFPILLALLVLIKDIKKKIILAPLTLLMFLTLVGSNSRGGMFGTAVAVIIFLIAIRKQVFEQWKIVLISVLILSIGVTSVNKLSGGRLNSQITRLKADIVSFLNKEEKIEDPDAYIIKDLWTKDNILEIETSRETLKMRINKEQVEFLDEKDNIIETEYNLETGSIILSDERYAGYNLSMLSDGEKPRIELNLGGHIAKFVVVDNKFEHYKGPGISKEIKRVESYGFEGKEDLGSYRGYIWSRTLPMLKENIVIGNGPDTYAIYFPQEDFVGRFNTNTLAGNMIVDKPHNLYLQIATNTGVLSLFAFLAIVIMYIAKSVKIYFKSQLQDEMEILGLGLFIAVIAYLLAGIFNDSVVSVAPIFWAVLGMGVAINGKVIKCNSDCEQEY